MTLTRIVCKNFNPLPRKEGDFKEVDANDIENISIHSLVKRETISHRIDIDTMLLFQSTPS